MIADALNQAKELFLTALEHQKQGELEQAESLYGKALELVPDRPSVINNLAAVLLQLKRFEEAKKWCEKLLAMDARNVTAILNFGNCQLALHSPEAALKSYDDALAIDPRNIAALVSRSKALIDLKRPAEALAGCDKALTIQPDYVDALNNRGGALQDLKRHANALATYDHLLTLMPDCADALYNRGNVMLSLKRYDEALASFDQALAINSDHAEALSNRGDALQKLERHDEALASYDDALAIKPDFVGAYTNRGEALQKLARYEDALASFDKALAIAPGSIDALIKRGIALQNLQRHDDALASYDKALAIDPASADAFNNRGNALQNLRRYEDALASFGSALALKPDHREAQWNESLCRLLIGDFAKGWEKYEARWHDEQGQISRRSGDFPLPLWDGQYVDGVLLAWGEQGPGDQILHASMLDELRSRAKRLVVETEPRLLQLLARSFPEIEFIARPINYDAIHFDAHTPMGSIGRYFRNDWKDFPIARTGYLLPDEKRAAHLREKYAGAGRMLVGLSWLSKDNALAEHKSARLRDFEPMLKLPGIKFVDLQYGDTRDERYAVAQSTGIEILHVAEVDNYQDIDGLAALISACDAVVSISNTTVHLAGALGKPTYIMVPYAQGRIWYWHLDRDVSPWYPTVRLFRQPALGDWDGVIRHVTQVLALS